MKTFDITLPNTQKIVFPPRCVVCEKENPGAVCKLSFLGIKTASLLTMVVDKALDMEMDPKYYGSNTLNKIDGVPACKGCAAGLKWYHRLLKLGYYTAWIPGLILLLLGVPTFLSVAVVIIGAISPGILTLVFPPSFGASFWDNRANFEFKSQKTAEEFLQLNAEATLKKESKTETTAAAL